MDNVLTEAVSYLASFFNVAPETIMEHTNEFLAKYGWYLTLRELPMLLVACVMMTGVLYYLVSYNSSFKIKNPWLMFFTIFIISMFMTVGISIVSCAVTPEIVGIHGVMEFLRTVG